MFVLIRVQLAVLFAFTAYGAAADIRAATRTIRGNALADFNPQGIVTRPLTLSPTVHLTNAQRLARGLPPNPPRVRRILKPRQSSTCIPQSGIILATLRRADGDQRVGYVSRTPNDFGEFVFTDAHSKALSVSICHDTVSGGFFDVLAMNGPADYPYFGAVRGPESTSDDLSPGNYNYAFFVGTVQTARGPAIPDDNTFSATTTIPSDVESVIWRLEPTTNELVPSWVNTNGGTPQVEIVAPTITREFVLTGDREAFSERFGKTYIVTLIFVPY